MVGTADNPTPPGDPTLAHLAVIWQDGQIVDLNGLIPAESGWVLTTTYGINDAGQIVGFGFIKGKQRGFVLTPATA